MTPEERERAFEEKVVNNQRMLSEMVSTEGWQIARRLLFEMMDELDSISNVDLKGRNAQEVVNEIAGRDAARDMVKDWIGKIDGEVAEYNGQNKSDTRQEEDEEYLKRLGYDPEEEN